jgi:PleD family two-component response regulator
VTAGPAAKAAAGLPQGAEPNAPPDRDAPLKARILIVDDDERNAFAAVEALADLGHDLVVARSGEEALKKLLVEEFALILLDLHMPGMDGYETAALVRTRSSSSPRSTATRRTSSRPTRLVRWTWSSSLSTRSS